MQPQICVQCTKIYQARETFVEVLEFGEFSCYCSKNKKKPFSSLDFWRISKSISVFDPCFRFVYQSPQPGRDFFVKLLKSDDFVGVALKSI